jgi:hypothetical protein
MVETHFLERAKYYRFAAAMTKNSREIDLLCDVALMFERMARDVRRLREGQSPPVCGQKAELPPVAAGFRKIWHILARFIRLAEPR